MVAVLPYVRLSVSRCLPYRYFTLYASQRIAKNCECAHEASLGGPDWRGTQPRHTPRGIHSYWTDPAREVMVSTIVEYRYRCMLVTETRCKGTCAMAYNDFTLDMLKQQFDL